MFFYLGKSKHKIGSKLFPVTHKNKTKVFDHFNTEKIDNEKLANTLDMITFQSGNCYSNAEVIRTMTNRVNINIEYYCGWIFIGDQSPMHHAWCVLDGNVIDVNISASEMFILSQADLSDPDWRKKIAPKLIEHQNNKPPTSLDCVMGRVPDGITYVGCPDEYEHAKRLFRILMKDYPKHPSYYGRIGENGGSQLQEEIFKLEQTKSS